MDGANGQLFRSYCCGGVSTQPRIEHGLSLGNGRVTLGILLKFLYGTQPELSQATVFATRKVDEVFGRLIGYVMIFPRDYD